MDELAVLVETEKEALRRAKAERAKNARQKKRMRRNDKSKTKKSQEDSLNETISVMNDNKGRELEQESQT